MNTKFLYSTAANATNMLRKAGFNKDFTIHDNHIIYNSNKIDIDELKIVIVFRYEGDSDPADEVSVYGLQTNTGIKGILITGQGSLGHESSRQTLKKLHHKFLQSVTAELSPYNTAKIQYG
jgi:hypothetical protein